MAHIYLPPNGGCGCHSVPSFWVKLIFLEPFNSPKLCSLSYVHSAGALLGSLIGNVKDVHLWAIGDMSSMLAHALLFRLKQRSLKASYYFG